MKKTICVISKAALILLVLSFVFGLQYVFINRDKIVTSEITMDYFSKTVNSNNEEMTKSFVANSEGDVLYNNFNSLLNNYYHYDGISNFKFKITEKEVFTNGKYQCYFANAFENHVPKCDLENEGRYMNYLIDADVSYTLNNENITQKEKGLVVFVKDMQDGNYFTWKLVRFDRYIVTD